MNPRDKTMRPIVFLGGAAAALCLGLAAPAVAQPAGFALSRFQPPFAGDRLFGVESPYAAGDKPALHGMLLLDYAHDPLVVRGAGSDRFLGAIVSHQAAFHFNLSLAFFRRLTLNVDLPVSIQSGDAPASGGASFPEPSSGAAGDLRIGARFTIYGGYHDPFQIAVGGSIGSPPGAARRI